MNRENMKTWIEALESGQYSQTRTTLHDKEGFCCLGVLCDINDVEWKINNVGDFVYDDGETHRGFPGHQVMDWLGVDLTDLTIPGHLISDAQFETLGWSPRTRENYRVSNLNDFGLSFAEIAALLRKAYLQ